MENEMTTMSWRTLRPKALRKTAEPELRIESREQLVYLLSQACELEHGLMCEYLFAQFSLKRSIEEAITEEQLGRILAWEGAIVGVVMQEMLHLALATNLLTAIGAPPHFSRPNFPILSGWYPDGVQIALVPFGERALRHFIFLERPEGLELDDAEGFQALEHARPLVHEGDLMAEPQPWQTVGHLYRGVEAGLRHLVERYGEHEVFIGPRRGQARWQAFGWSEITPIKSLEDAQQAIDHIVEQGEGARGDWRAAHFGIFVGILDELRRMREADPTFEPARNVVPAYVHEPDDVDAPVVIIGNLLTAQVADLFDATYETALQALGRYFVHTTESNEQVATLAFVAKRLMSRGLRPLGIALTGLPVGSDPNGPRAGASFTIVPATFYLLPHRNAAWHVLRHRLGELADRAAQLAEDGHLPELVRVSTDLRALEARIAADMPGREDVEGG
jgi:hypothetical protein